MPLFDPIRIGAAGASTGYEIEKSLMLNDQRQTYLTFTPNQQGDRRTYTISWWIKFNTAGWEPEDGEDHYFISARRGSNNPQTDINFKGNRLCFEGVTGGSYEYSAATVRRNAQKALVSELAAYVISKTIQGRRTQRMRKTFSKRRYSRLAASRFSKVAGIFSSSASNFMDSRISLKYCIICF